MKAIRNITILLGLAALGACSSLNSPSGNNTTRAQFLDEVWVSPNVRGKAAYELFSKVYFAPVSTAHLSKQGWWESQTPLKKRELEMDARKLAVHARKALENAVRNDPERRLTVAGQPGSDTLIVEMAITELVPAKAYWNAAATTAGFVVPGAGLLGAAGSGSITIEGRMRDGNTGAEIVNFRDHMKDKMALVNIDSYSWYGGSEANLDETALKIARVLNAAPGTVVSQSSRIKLIAY